jgi:hypothetical protein
VRNGDIGILHHSMDNQDLKKELLIKIGIGICRKELWQAAAKFLAELPQMNQSMARIDRA